MEGPSPFSTPVDGRSGAGDAARIQPWVQDRGKETVTEADGAFTHYSPGDSSTPAPQSEPIHQRLQRHARELPKRPARDGRIRRFHHSTAEHTGTSLFLFAVHLAVTFGVAWLLREHGPLAIPHQRIQERDPEVGRMVFHYGLFDEKECWNDHFSLCALSWCCLSIQWASTLTNDKVNLMGSFWVALAVATTGYHELNNLTVGLSHLLFVIIAVYYRQKLREKFGLESGTLETLTQDCFVWCFCCWCAVAQEARQVDFVKTVDTTLVPFGGTLQLQRATAPRQREAPAATPEAEEQDVPTARAGLLHSQDDADHRHSSGSHCNNSLDILGDDSGY